MHKDLILLKKMLNQTYFLAVFNKKLSVKSDFILKNRSIFTFNDKGLDTQRFDKKINYTDITRFKF